ncbi:kinase-like domain-containing protein [Hyaloraphidium curvatum]|nr:kinase-like domain-containing protein [Hyaloraphidium curvatum]
MASPVAAEWFAACRNADIATVRRILNDKSFDAGVREPGSKFTGLHIAASKTGDGDFIKELADLISKRATGKRDVNKVTPTGDTAFLLAVKSDRFNSFKGLLDASVTQDGYKLRDPDGMSAWLLACREGKEPFVNEMLTRFGWIEYNDRDRDGMTGLALACARGHCGVARAIMNAALPDQYPVNRKLADNEGRTPFYWLCSRDCQLVEGSKEHTFNTELIRLFMRENQRTGAHEVDCRGLCTERTAAIVEKYRIYYAAGHTGYKLSDPENLQIVKGRQLGEGGLGKVDLGLYNGEEFAVKTVLLGTARGQLPKEMLEKEFNVWAELRDPSYAEEPGYHNILDVKGYFAEKDRWKILSPAVKPESPHHKAADLHHWLWYNRNKTNYFPRALRLLQGAAAGMAFIHRRNIVHGDLKAGNFVVDRGTAKLIDFGMARFRAEGHSVRSSGFNFRGGTEGFNAPDLSGGRIGRTNRKTDIFSFAMVAYEVATGGCEVWFEEQGGRQNRLDKGLRPEAPKAIKECDYVLPQNIPEELWSLINRMWAQDPEDRPGSFEEIADAIGRIASRLEL